MPPGRIMGLDVGDKRVGVALSDPSFTYALPHRTLERKGSGDIFSQITKIIKEEGISTVVIGMPFELSGEIGDQGKKVQSFAGKLKSCTAKQFGPDTVSFEFWDERFSTAQAERSLAGSKLKNADRSRAVDKIAASFILEGYLIKRKAEQA